MVKITPPLPLDFDLKTQIETTYPSKTHASAKVEHLRIPKLLGFGVFIFAII